MSELLQHIAHRPYPVPGTNWTMAQTWNDLLFAHWPIDLQKLRPHVPAFLEIDTFEGSAWIGVVPFHMTDIHFRNTPPVPLLSAFPELNVRTYVRSGDKSGVYFFSLDAANLVAVEVARMWFSLPYYYAEMSSRDDAGMIRYSSKRRDSRGKTGSFEADYQPIGVPYAAEVGTLEHWLTERYCFLGESKSGQLIIGEVHHLQWPLQLATAEIKVNTMVEALGIDQPKTEPLLHFVRTLDTIEWSIRIATNGCL